jgi:hypothetical protein
MGRISLGFGSAFAVASSAKLQAQQRYIEDFVLELRPEMARRYEMFMLFADSRLNSGYRQCRTNQQI